MNMIRAFIAFPIPDELRKNLGNVQAKIQKNMFHLRPVKPQGIHLTLHFLGDMDSSKVYEVGKVMDLVCQQYKPLNLVCRKIGAFPDMHGPRVLWAGLEGQVAPLQAIHQDLAKGLEKIGFQLEKRPLTPHLTLFRLKKLKQMGALRKRIEKLGKADFGEIRCDTLVLYKSELTPEGALYSKLKMSALD